VDDTRLTEVEIRYTYLEKFTHELNQVVREQQQTITTLTTRLERVERLIREAMQQSGEPLPHEKPPHY
jgi:uncharacterized coiled-coil protein SlyX